MRKSAFVFVAVALFGFASSLHIANALTVPVDPTTSTPAPGLQVVIAAIGADVEHVIASIEAVVGNIATAITGHAAVASNTASAAVAITPSSATEAPIAPNVPTAAPPSTPAVTLASPTVPATPTTGAASDNVFELQSAVAQLTQGIQDLVALYEAQSPSSKIESQIAVQSALASQQPGQNYNASAYFPLGDGTGIAAASNIGQLSGVTITNASINAASIPDLSGSYLSLGGGVLTGSLGIGTTTPGSLFSLGGIANFTTATSTLYGSGGFNITHGCYALNGTCISGGGGSSQWTNAGSNIYFGRIYRHRHHEPYLACSRSIRHRRPARSCKRQLLGRRPCPRPSLNRLRK